MGIYLNSGYLNQKWIEEQADKQNISFIVEIGGRQVGKTYGCLKLALDRGTPFILLRRTQTETDFICNDINNPFTVFRNSDIKVKHDTKYTARINRHDGDQIETIGSVMALSTIAKIRGFNGSIYTDLIFDEFIPENHVTKIKNEGDAFLNALITISGNREIDGIKPLRVWLLANANTITSPILEALNIQTKIDEMINRGQELSIMPERGIMIIMPHSDQIMELRKQTSIMKAISGKSQFAKMAFENEFSYNDSSNIRSYSLKEFRPLFGIMDKFTVYKHKSKTLYFVTKYRTTSKIYGDTERDRKLLLKQYPNLRNYYIKGIVYFSDLIVKTKFIDIIQ